MIFLLYFILMGISKNAANTVIERAQYEKFKFLKISLFKNNNIESIAPNEDTSENDNPKNTDLLFT